MRARLEALEATGHSTANLYVSDRLTSPFPYNILEPARPGQLSNLQWLTAAVEKVKPVVLIVDTWRETFQGDENSSDIAKQAMDGIVSAAGPAAVIILSHSKKDSLFDVGGSDNLFGDNRGSGYVAGRMDTVVKMTDAMMCFQGRSVGRTNLPIVRYDKNNPPPSGLLELAEGAGLGDMGHAMIDQLLIAILTSEPHIGRNKLELRVAAQMKVSQATVKRRLSELKPGPWRGAVDTDTAAAA